MHGAFTVAVAVRHLRSAAGDLRGSAYAVAAKRGSAEAPPSAAA
eukprot:gene43515-1856_t